MNGRFQVGDPQRRIGATDGEEFLILIGGTIAEFSPSSTRPASHWARNRLARPMRLNKRVLVTGSGGFVGSHRTVTARAANEVRGTEIVFSRVRITRVYCGGQLLGRFTPANVLTIFVPKNKESRCEYA